MLVLPYLKAAKESCVCGDNDTVYLYILPLSEWSSLDRILRPFQGGRCSAVSNLSGLWCRHHQWGQDQEQNVKMSLRSTISTLFLCQAFNQYLESRLLSCRLLLDQISKTQQVNEWYWWYCREHTSPTLEPEVTPQRTRPSMTKRCFSALRKREQRKPRKLRPLPRTATCYKVRLLSQLVHKAASVWHFELSPWEWSIVWPNIHQHHQLNLCCFYDLKCLQMTSMLSSKDRVSVRYLRLCGQLWLPCFLGLSLSCFWKHQSILKRASWAFQLQLVALLGTGWICRKKPVCPLRQGFESSGG